MFLRSFGRIKTSSITLSSTAQKLASTEVLEERMDNGRIALEVNNTEGESAAYIGDENVTTTTGIPVPAGQTRIFPVQQGCAGNIYGVGSGAVIIAEYF